TDSVYINTDRRIIGLPSERVVYDAGSNIVSRQTYDYDWDGNYFSPQQPSTNYDSDNFPSWFISGRGNLVAVRRFDCTNNTSAYNNDLAMYIKSNGYNMAGSNIWTADASGHTANISYSDNFSDSSKNQNALGYPTAVTDADGYSSTAQYNYDFGAITRTH